MTYIEQADPNVDVEQLEDRELMMLHTALHSKWKHIQNGRPIEDWSKNDVIETHEEVRSQLDDRGLPHPELNDLDDEPIEQSATSLDIQIGPVLHDPTPEQLKAMAEVLQGVKGGEIDSVLVGFDRRKQQVEFFPDGKEPFSPEQIGYIAQVGGNLAGEIRAPPESLVDLEDNR